MQINAFLLPREAYFVSHVAGVALSIKSFPISFPSWVTCVHPSFSHMNATTSPILHAISPLLGFLKELRGHYDSELFFHVSNKEII